MSQRDRSNLMSHSQLNMSGVLSQLNSKQIVQSHISEVLPNYKGGKKQHQYIVFFISESFHSARNFEKCLKSQLIETFGQYMQYKTFKDKGDILDENIKTNVLYYIIAQQKIHTWAEKFSRQERQTNGKKYIGVIRMWSHRKKYEEKLKEKNLKSNKTIKNQLDSNYIFDMNMEMDAQSFTHKVKEELIPFIEQKLTYKMDKQKNQAKNWAISNKFKKKEKKKQKLYLYVEKDPSGNIIKCIEDVSKIYAKKGRYKWVQVIPFEHYSDIAQHIQKRQDDLVEQVQMASLASNVFHSRIMDKSVSKIGTTSKIGSPSKFGTSSKFGASSKLLGSNIRSQNLSPSTLSSNKHIPIGQMQHKISRDDNNYIICSRDYQEIKKLYSFVLAQKVGNWKLIEYSDDNISQIRKQIAKMVIDSNKKQEQSTALDMVQAKTLYIFVPYEDNDLQNIYKQSKNYCRNTEMMLYQSSEQLRSLLNLYSRNIDNYTVIFLRYSNSQEHRQVLDFIEKNSGFDDKNKGAEALNMIYKFTSGNNYNSVTSYLSMNSMNSLYNQYNQNNQSSYVWLKAILEDRDRFFHPLDGLQGRNVYILARYDHQNQLLDPEMQDYIVNSARLQKATYRDESYLRNFIKNIRIKKDSVIVLTNDSTMRQAQNVAKDFDEVAVMNITERSMKDQIKILAWGPKSSIYEILKTIHEKKQKLRKKHYNQFSHPQYLERQPRILPQNIDFKGGKLVTIRMPKNQNDKNSGIMENNLDAYFDQQIRFEYYDDPKQVRLINKKQEPLSFTICEDKQQDLEYMKKISREQKNHLRQEYILYTKNPQKHKYLVKDTKHPRFTFLSNSWEKIEDYIIGNCQLICGFDNDWVYDDELVHVFYLQKDQQYMDYLMNITKDKQINRILRTHLLEPETQVKTMMEVLALQSPHHLYFFLVNQKQNVTTIKNARQLISKGNLGYINYAANLPYNVPQKTVKMLVIRQQKLAGKQKDIKATFSNGQQAAHYIASTKLQQYSKQKFQPHIIINTSTQYWYYFLDKYKNLFDRYHFHYTSNTQQMSKLINDIRQKEYGSKIWILLNKEAELKNYSKLVKNFERGRGIDFIYLGDGWVSKQKILLTDGNRGEIKNFILNFHKRSTRFFSPEALLPSLPPRIYMTEATSSKLMISETQKQKWIEDFQAEFFIYPNTNDDPKNNHRPVFLIQDIDEDVKLKGYNHIRRIVYDSNVSHRQKNHEIGQIYPNKKDLYIGYYPAQITEYLRFLRFNIKNPPLKIQREFSGQLTRVYKQENIYLDTDYERILYSKNHSIVDITSFKYLDQAIMDSKKYPSYNILFILSRLNAQKMKNLKSDNKYIAFDVNQRIKPMRSSANLQTEDYQEYMMYLYNLPQKRYDKASNLKQTLDVYIMQNSPVSEVAKQLVSINKRNTAFNLKSYRNINDLRNINEYIIVLATNDMYESHKKQLGYQKNINYFILDDERFRYLSTDSKRYEFFITKSSRIQLQGFFNNARINQGNDRIAQNRPIVDAPGLLKKPLEISRPLMLWYLDPNRKFILYPPFEIYADDQFVPPYPYPDPHPHPPTPTPIPHDPYDKSFFIDSSRADMFQLPANFRPDHIIPSLNIVDYYNEKDKEPIPVPPHPVPPAPLPNPLTVTFDSPPHIDDKNFCSLQDNDNILTCMLIPEPKKVQKTLAILYPQSKQFHDIIKVLRQNLHPKSYLISEFPYKSDYDLQNYFRNSLQKFESGYDKTLFFFYPKYYKHLQNLKVVKKRMGSRLKYYMFEDDFHNYYEQFKIFLSPYTMANHSIPYINKEDPQYWLSTTLYNVMVPINFKKRYDCLKSQNVRVMIYKQSDLLDIANQLHCQNQFVIIVCNKENFHNLKHFPRLSPRCIIVVEDNEILKTDEVPLFRYPRKVLYYGPDALTYLQKYRIPTKKLPIKQQSLKTLFFNPKIRGDYEQAVSEHYDSYEKIPYIDHEDLFCTLIERFRNCNNFKLPTNRSIKTPIKLIPKLYMKKNAPYQAIYKNQFSALQAPPQFKHSFKTDIRPSQYAHLPIRQYDGSKDLVSDLERQDCPCLAYIDVNYRQFLKVERDFKNRHLFISMFDTRDRWIEKNGDLTQTHLLARPDQLTVKQILFTSMFNQQVFDAYNDMGYFYLSNKADRDKTRNITFMTKQKLLSTYDENQNLLMIIFVQSVDKQYIPAKFYDPKEDRSQVDRVKLIFLHHTFIHKQYTLYIKFNQIDPVIIHINRVQISGRVDYCLYPTGELGNLVWHQFSQRNKGYQSLSYNSVEQIDRISQDIKGKFRNVMVICDKDDKGSIQQILDYYSIKTKPLSNQKVKFELIPQIQKYSYALATSAIKKSQILHFNDHEEDFAQKFETVGNQGIDIKMKSSYRNSRIQDVIQGKNFVLSVHQKLKDTFPIGNFYASKIKYFKNITEFNLSNQPGKSQLIISNENYPEIQKLTSNRPDLFVVYVSNQMKPGQTGNTMVIKQHQIPALISKLEGSARQQGDVVALNQQSDGLNIRNIEDYKVIRIVYDDKIDKETKKKILNISVNNKNIFPVLFQNINHVKKMLKEEDSLILLMMSSEPPELDQQLKNDDYVIVRKKKTKMIIHKRFDSAIDGLSTILQQRESQMQNIIDGAENLTESNIDLYLKIIEKDPEKNKKMLLVPNYHSHDEEEQNKGIQNQQQNLTKLKVHSVIRQDNTLNEEQVYKIRQILDGGVIVVVVQDKFTSIVQQILNRYNTMIQEYRNAVNFNQIIRECKDKVTIVVIQKNMLNNIIPLKQQFPRLVFILLNQNSEPISKQYHPYFSGQITKITEIQMIISDIYEQNQKIKYSEQAKSPSRVDNRKVSTVDAGNSERFSVGFNNTRAKKAFVFFKQPQNSLVIKRISQVLNNITFVPYKSKTDLQKKINNYQGYQTILIANSDQIIDLQDYISKKKQHIYVIRYNPPNNLKVNSKIKTLLLSTSSEQAISNCLYNFTLIRDQRTITSRMNQQKNIPQTKNYVQKYQPNLFGTTPRFPQDFVPPKSKGPTYSKRYLKSASKSSSKLISRDPRSNEDSGYYHH